MAKGGKVLIYNVDLNSPTGIKLRNAVRICGSACQSVAADDCGQTVGYLLGLEGYAESSEKISADDRAALIFYSFTKQELDRLLGALKRSGVYIPLKAVVTEHNINWTVTALLDELQKEHALMTAWQKLNTCVKKYKGKDRELVKEAKELLSAHSPDADAINEMIQRLEKSKSDI